MKKPNILWICTDQQRFDTLGCYGNTMVQTPHIDRLAQHGVLFENAFCQSTVCTPSRASFLTGRYPRTTRCRQNGQSMPADEKLVTRLLADAGYICGLSGKLHISACHPKVSPITEPRIDDGYVQFHWSHDASPQWPLNEYHQWLKQNGIEFKRTMSDESKYVSFGPDVEHHQTTWVANRAIDFMETMKDSKMPWLFSVNIYDPHHPFDPPKEYYQRYLEQLERVGLPNYQEGELDTKTFFQNSDHNGVSGNARNFPYVKMNQQDHLALRAAYFAMVDFIDDQVGRMLDVLEKTGQADNTIVIFMSDHGELLGDHGVYLKGPHFYEPSIKVPLIISMPGKVRTNVQIRSLVELVDIAPTLLDAADLPMYQGMQGKSLWPLLTEEAGIDQHREDVYCEYYNSNFNQNGIGAFGTMVRTEQYKLVKYHKSGEGELYDLHADPTETTNQWRSQAYASVKIEMLDRLCDRMAETVDPLPVRQAPW